MYICFWSGEAAQSARQSLCRLRYLVIKLKQMLETLRDSAVVIQALVAIVSVLLVIFLLYITRRQSRIGRLIVLREIVREHHSRKMRDLRRIVRNDLTAWIKNHEILDEADPTWRRLKSAYEDILNYYEYLGTMLRENDDNTILRMTHASAIAIWDIHQQYGDRIRPQATRAVDFAREFSFLVEKVREYQTSK
jgi:hypothetical protein